MNNLTTISDNELKALKSELEGREKALETKEGKKEAAAVMLAMFDYFQTSGYRLPDVNYKKMAAAYADQMKECIIAYGYNKIKEAAREYIKRDASGYHGLPTAGELIAVVKDIADDPRREIRRREFEKWIEEDDKRVHAELLRKAKEAEKNE